MNWYWVKRVCLVLALTLGLNLGLGLTAGCGLTATGIITAGIIGLDRASLIRWSCNYCYCSTMGWADYSGATSALLVSDSFYGFGIGLLIVFVFNGSFEPFSFFFSFLMRIIKLL